MLGTLGFNLKVVMAKQSGCPDIKLSQGCNRVVIGLS